MTQLKHLESIGFAEKPAEGFPLQCSNVCDVRKGCGVAHWCQLRSGHEADHQHLCTVIAELERAVIEAAVLRRQIEIEGRGHTTSDNLHAGLGLKFYEATKAEQDAVDELLKARE